MLSKSEIFDKAYARPEPDTALTETRYHVILPALEPGGPQEITRLSVMWPLDPPFDALRDLINGHLDGGYMQHLRVFWGFEDQAPDYTDMFVDECFMRKQLKRNALATQIYRNNTMVHDARCAHVDSPYIAGPAVLFGRRVWW